MQSIFAAKKRGIREAYDALAPRRGYWIGRNEYYYRELIRIIGSWMEGGKDVLQFGCGNGYLLSRLNARNAVGIDLSPEMIAAARKSYPGLTFLRGDAEDPPELGRKFDYILLVNVVGDIIDLQTAFSRLSPYCRRSTRIIIIYYNYLWEPVVKLAEKLRLKIKEPTQNWLSPADIGNLLYLSGLETVHKDNYLFFPFHLPGFSFLVNRVIFRLPLLNRLCFANLIVARPSPQPRPGENLSVSVIVPCKDEEGNIEDVVRRTPPMGKKTEIIIVDDQSTDGTAAAVEAARRRHPGKDVILVNGPGRGKFEAVKAGFAAASGDILMILDADATVMPEELPLFFQALAEGRGEFINGCRLVYEMEKQAMRLLNILGNKLFGLIFSYLLSQRIKDTLCGTKAFFRDDYLRMKRYFSYFGSYDRWGDFNLLFSACKLNLKIIDLPVHYVERIEGETKMKRRFSHGWLMLRMCWEGARRFKLLLGREPEGISK